MASLSKNSLLQKAFDRSGRLIAIVALGLLLYRFVLPRPSDPLDGLAGQVLVSPGMVTLIELGATYCPPCWAMKPIVLGLKRAYRDRVAIKVLDIDAPGDPIEARRLSEAIQLRATPTMVVTDRQGHPTAKFIGSTSYAALAGAIDAALATPGSR